MRSVRSFIARSAGRHGPRVTCSVRGAAEEPAAAETDQWVSFSEEFIVSQVDYHQMLLEEANKKHNVPLNLPPQLNPPTDEHRCVYTDALGRKMQEPERHFAFQPLHGPPPRIPEMEPKIEKRPPPPQAEPKKKKGGGGGGGSAKSDDKPFKCSVCGKLFRMEPAAKQHIESQHADVSGATVVDMSADSKPEPAASPAPEAKESKEPPAPKTSLSAGPNPLKELLENMALSSDAAVGLDTPTEPPVIYALPTDDDIDALLLDTWDVVGKKVGGADFKPCASFIISDTDAEVAQKNAANGTNFFGSATKGQSAPSLAASAAQGAANPLASPVAKASLTTGGFSSPFINANNFNAPMPSSQTTAHAERKFKCEHCPKTFRLLDAVLTHYAVDHDAEPSEARMAEFKALDNPHVAALKAKAEAAAKSESAADAAEDAKASAEPEKELKPPPQVVDLNAHVRAASNIVLCGQVRELKFGYVDAEPVAQLLLEVESGADRMAWEPESEYVTVRAFGEQYTDLLQPALERGGSVVVNGTLKLNFHTVPEAGEAYPFPYVKVVPPYGDVTPVVV